MRPSKKKADGSQSCEGRTRRSFEISKEKEKTRLTRGRSQEEGPEARKKDKEEKHRKRGSNTKSKAAKENPYKPRLDA